MENIKVVFAIVVFVLLLGIWGCKKKDTQKVTVQFINASMHTPYLEFFLQGSKQAEFIGYNICSNSNTADLETGEPLVIEIKDPATGTTVASGSYTNWKPNWHYTFVMYDDYPVRKTTLLSDSTEWPAAGKFKLRFMNFSPGAPALDLFFGTDTVGFNKTYFATDSTHAIDSVRTLNAATFTVTLKNHATGQTCITLPNMGIADNRILDVYASGIFSDSLNFPLQLGWAAH